jgi:hypothetical protein
MLSQQLASVPPGAEGDPTTVGCLAGLEISTQADRRTDDWVALRWR